MEFSYIEKWSSDRHSPVGPTAQRRSGQHLSNWVRQRTHRRCFGVHRALHYSVPDDQERFRSSLPTGSSRALSVGARTGSRAVCHARAAERSSITSMRSKPTVATTRYGCGDIGRQLEKVRPGISRPSEPLVNDGAACATTPVLYLLAYESNDSVRSRTDIC